MILAGALVRSRKRSRGGSAGLLTQLSLLDARTSEPQRALAPGLKRNQTPRMRRMRPLNWRLSGGWLSSTFDLSNIFSHMKSPRYLVSLFPSM